MEEASCDCVVRVGGFDQWEESACHEPGELPGEVTEKRDDNPTRVRNLERGQLFEPLVDFDELGIDRLPNAWKSTERGAFSYQR